MLDFTNWNYVGHNSVNATPRVTPHGRRMWAAVRHRAAEWTSTDYSRCRWNNRGDVEGALRDHLDWSVLRLPDQEAVGDPYRHAARIRQRVGSVPHAGICQPTVAGLDGLPAWFLRVAAPIFCKTIAYVFNMSLAIHQQYRGSEKKPKSDHYT